MGWSCQKEAMDTLEAMDKCNFAAGRSSNEYIGKDGKKYFYQTSNREHDDGRISGTVYVFLPGGELVQKVGSFSIDPWGELKRAPKSWPYGKGVGCECGALSEKGDNYCANCGKPIWDCGLSPKVIR